MTEPSATSPPDPRPAPPGGSRPAPPEASRADDILDSLNAPEVRALLASHPDMAAMTLQHRPDGTREPVAVLRVGAEPLGLRVETVLRNAVQDLARDKPSDAVERVKAAASILPPPTSEPGLALLGDLRWGLLEVVADRIHAVGGQGDPGVVVFVIHEVVSLGRSRESRRRNNREDMDRFVRRLSAGRIPRLQRGIMAGPILVDAGGGPVKLYLGKARRDLP